ncbi:MAG: hypothetical protein SF029_14185 [bacterium]|nr:hypothetical protein [bacterium]
MAIDQDTLRGRRAVAVEGERDRSVLEAFLEAGAKRGRWRTDWRDVVAIIPVRSSPDVIKAANAPTVFGILDRDWRSEDEIKVLETTPGLWVLPRVMIENYVLDPDELVRLMPATRREQFEPVHQAIVSELDHWLQNGAMWKATYELGADYFCRDKDDQPGYPQGLRRLVPVERNRARELLEDWYQRLDPERILERFEFHLAAFRKQSNPYHRCIAGKDFFNQVVCKALNDTFGQQTADRWIADLLTDPPDCPVDLLPILQAVLS